MEISRREFGILAVGAIVGLTLSETSADAGQFALKHPLAMRTAIAEPQPIIVIERGAFASKIRVASKLHHVTSTVAPSLSDGFTNLNFGPWKPGMPGVCPSGGQMSVYITNNGDWSFGGSFPTQASNMNCTVSLAIGLRSSNGKVVAFTDSGTVTSQGWTFNKQGNSTLIQSMWPNFVAGHDFKGSWLAHQVPRANHQHSGGGSQSGGSDATDVLTTITDVLGVASLIL